MLSEEQIAALEKKLVATEEDLRAEIKDLETVPEFGSDNDHMEEEGDEAEEFSKNMGEAEAFKNRLEDVVHALSKIEQGTYGTCESCKKTIGFDLLKIDPESRLCKECKKKEKRR